MMERNLNIPNDVSLIGVDDLRIARMVHPSLTTIAHSIEIMCKKAVELIVKMVAGEQLEELTILIEPYIVDRESVCILDPN